MASWSNSTIQARYPSARDGAASPAEGFFDSISDAQTAINARGGLLGVERRVFTVNVADLIWLDPSAGVPCVTLVDNEQNVNGTFLVMSIVLDLEAETTTLELFG